MKRKVNTEAKVENMLSKSKIEQRLITISTF